MMAWKKTGVATTLLAAMAATGAQAQQSAGPSLGPAYWDGHWHGWFMGPLMMLIFMAVVVAVVVLVVRWLGASDASREAPGRNTPLDILKERFARGEIDKAEFDERRKVLEE